MSERALPNVLKPGDYYAICDTCGQRYWASTMRTRWDGAFVDDGCWDPYPEAFKSKVIVEDREVPIARDRTYDSTNANDATPITIDSSNLNNRYVVV